MLRGMKFGIGRGFKPVTLPSLIPNTPQNPNPKIASQPPPLSPQPPSTASISLIISLQHRAPSSLYRCRWRRRPLSDAMTACDRKKQAGDGRYFCSWWRIMPPFLLRSVLQLRLHCRSNGYSIAAISSKCHTLQRGWLSLDVCYRGVCVCLHASWFVFKCKSCVCVCSAGNQNRIHPHHREVVVVFSDHRLPLHCWLFCVCVYFSVWHFMVVVRLDEPIRRTTMAANDTCFHQPPCWVVVHMI